VTIETVRPEGKGGFAIAERGGYLESIDDIPKNITAVGR
jgi:hypothetical protein